MRLAHLHFPKPIPYAHSLRLQEAVLEAHFNYNAHILRSLRSTATASAASARQPSPTLLTFQSHPVYTVGRRHLKANPLSDLQIDFLTTNSSSPNTRDKAHKTKLATFYPSPRGGLLTYHAPGQLTAYLIINLRSHDITPRCFIRLLEKAVIQTCAQHGVSNTMTTADPGVWIGENESKEAGASQLIGDFCGGNPALKATTRKICAVGVHVTRGITSHGIGLNVFDAPITSSAGPALYMLPTAADTVQTPAPGFLSWGFGRIIACGLEGKSVTWLTNEGAAADLQPDVVAGSLAEAVCVGLTRQGKVEITGIDRIGERDILGNLGAYGPRVVD